MKEVKTCCARDCTNEPSYKNGYCTPCGRQKSKEYRLRQAAKEGRTLRRRRKIKTLNMKEYRQQYYQENKAKMDAQNKRWREENPEKYRASRNNWIRNNEGHTYFEPSNGYVVYVGFNHPATNAGGLTFQHRIILWDKLNGQDAPCHWCGRELFWSKKYPQNQDALITDHVNNIKDDNRPENLVPSCGLCNITREGGQSRKPRELVNVGPCAVDFCDRVAKAGQLCSAHWQQRHAGKPFTPVRRHAFAETDDTHRRCNYCQQRKPLDEFYLTTKGQIRARCKDCTVKYVAANKAKRLARNIPCSKDGCTKPAETKGMCHTHYHYEWKAARTNA